MFEIVFALLTPSECSEILNGRIDEVLFSVERRPCAEISRTLFAMEHKAGRRIEGRILKFLKRAILPKSLFYDHEICGEIAKLLEWALTQHQFDWNYQDDYGDTFLHFLASVNRSNILRHVDDYHNLYDVANAILNQKNIEPDLKNKRGETPLMNIFQRGGHPLALKLLDTNRVDLDSKDVHGRSILSWVSVSWRACTIFSRPC